MRSYIQGTVFNRNIHNAVLVSEYMYLNQASKDDYNVPSDLLSYNCFILHLAIVKSHEQMNALKCRTLATKMLI